ncbi:hypothetical protein DI272_01530 [Streptomyces sp. Act143]|uniref:hypothetical protein n=1 Tax=Streptomyces sp. Act143 TaxID=2200760 RepID=UPI000D6763D3|nr:hypothetical protein [Streptomyces sp. Act143]PWI12963.1 hypothetical protein DI272_01530 [Streptomyces sp. Act143]
MLQDVFFDQMKELGFTDAEIIRSLGCSETRLTRIANGRKLPTYTELFALLDMVDGALEQPLTETVRDHVWRLYLRAVGVGQQDLAEYYRLKKQEEDIRRRQQAMAAEEASRPPGAAVDDDLDQDHPAVQLRDEAARLHRQVARAGVPLPPQPLVTPPPGARRPPAVNAMLDHTAWLLDQVDQALIREIIRVEPVDSVSDEEAAFTPSRPAPPPPEPPFRFRPTAALPSRETARRVGHAAAYVLSLAVIVLCTVLVAGFVIDRLPTDNRAAAPSQNADQGDGASGNTTTSDGGSAPIPGGAQGARDTGSGTTSSDTEGSGSTTRGRDESSGPSTLPAPTLLQPGDGAVLTNSPRTTTVEWAGVTGASGYRVEVECRHCVTVGAWTPQANATTTGTSHTFEWPGDNEGRWRVTATSSDGTSGTTSAWRYFRYDTSMQAPMQLSPADGTVFDTYPRTTTLTWQPVSGASRYTVEVEFYDTDWRPWIRDETANTSYQFDFVGVQAGRWRVTGIAEDGSPGPSSSWWQFTYTA